MIAPANTTVTILTAESIDDYSGERAGVTASATGLIASITERTRIVDDPASDTPRVVRQITARLPNGTVVTRNDLVRDELTGREYGIRSVRQHFNVVPGSDLILELVADDSVDP